MFCHYGWLFLIGRHRALAQTSITFPADKALLTRTASEKQVQNPSGYRKKKENQNPCHSLYRTTIVKNHDKDSCQYHRKIKKVDYGYKDAIPNCYVHLTTSFSTKLRVIWKKAKKIPQKWN